MTPIFTPEQREQLVAELRRQVKEQILPDRQLRGVLDPLIVEMGFQPSEPIYGMILLGATLGEIGNGP